MFDIEKLRAVEGQELKYKALCEALDIPVKSSNSKAAQLNNLQMYCRLDTLDHPTRYIVREVYDGQLITEINGNNQYQEVFDAVMYQALLNADNQLLYLSNLELLSLFAEVNENFTYSLNRNIMMKLSDNPYKMVEMAQIVYRVLKQWTKRRIDLMEKRRIVITRKGFRLYSKTGHYIYKHNVPIDSELEQSCRKVWNDALNETIGLNWKGQWVPDDKWAAFKSVLHDASGYQTAYFCNLCKRCSANAFFLSALSGKSDSQHLQPRRYADSFYCPRTGQKRRIMAVQDIENGQKGRKTRGKRSNGFGRRIDGGSLLSDWLCQLCNYYQQTALS